jgi:hypothetical protein
MEGALFAGAAVAFPGLARGEQQGGNGGDSGTPLATVQIPQPEGPFIFWVGFSPVDDWTAFVSGTYDNMALYISRAGEPESFDVLWQQHNGQNCIKACAWSPNGREIAFLVQAVNKKTTPKSARISIYVADVVSKEAREPIVIAESIGKEEKQHVNVSYKKGLFWWDDSCVCVPADKEQGGGILKFDTHTGQSEPLAAAQNNPGITKMTRTRSGRMRFVKFSSPEAAGDKQILLCDLLQDGTVSENVNLTAQLGQIYSAHLSQDGDFVFAGQGDKWSPDLAANLIYKIETRSVIARIPLMVRNKGDLYSYTPVAVRDGNELILIEATALATDGQSTDKNRRTRAVKMTL